ncbi:UDP-Glycosyltransferase superfamily protein [Hibiscus syriacus]|uniref:UDP-Glycosyltransferase superfamily protein n=1 Tax=Hibiscus syriacus TaxID=106335 RepID=A0A6A3BJE9_HIBSY|nr:UDP-Glycosyltransferase superfamily protein [Hibiscus syriacus]
MAKKDFHIAMYPWLALGHITPFIHMANKLAERGHRISFFLPAGTLRKVEPFNIHPHLIAFIPVIVPHVQGLPLGAETTNEVPFPLHPLLVTAMDLTEPEIEASLRDRKPHFVFFDFACWLPALTLKLGIKALVYCIISSATIGYLLTPARKIVERGLTGPDLLEPPEGFASSSIKLHAHEARGLTVVTTMDYGSGFSFVKPGALRRSGRAGPAENGVGRTMEKAIKQLRSQDLDILCLLVALKQPMGAETIESALPEGFQERVKGRGFVHGGWVPQHLILNHPSVGCFVTQCGSGSLAEAMVNDCQLLLLPHVGDQIINARLMAGDLRIGVEVEKGEEDGLFTKDGVCKAVKAVMDNESELGKEAKANHAKWKEFLLAPGLERSYMNDFVMKLHTSV